MAIASGLTSNNGAKCRTVSVDGGDPREVFVDDGCAPEVPPPEERRACTSAMLDSLAGDGRARRPHSIRRLRVLAALGRQPPCDAAAAALSGMPSVGNTT